MSEQPQRPTSNDDLEAWKEYWARTQPEAWFKAWGYWRTEPEIGEERQRFLAERRAVKPDIERGIYPFRDENGSIKLTRADVEWVLATHESGGMVGPVEWADVQQRERDGLDLRGVDLRKVDLSGLPLANLIAGSSPVDEATIFEHEDLTFSDSDLRTVISVDNMLLLFSKGLDYPLPNSTPSGVGALDLSLEQLKFEMAAGHFEGADLSGAHFEGSHLAGAHMDGANLGWSRFEGADLYEASLIGAYCGFTRIEAIERSLGLWLSRQYDDADDFPGATFEGAHLTQARLLGADLTGANLRDADLTKADLAGASLRMTQLEGAKLRNAWLGGERISKIALEQIRVYASDFPGVLGGADLARATCDRRTRLDGIGLGSRKEGFVRLVDIQWGGANLMVMNWTKLKTADNEKPDEVSRRALKEIASSLWGRMGAKRWSYRFTLAILPWMISTWYQFHSREVAARANRQLANALRDQGMGRIADQFAYRAYVCGRLGLLVGGGIHKYLGSLLLDWISGYGFKPLRSLITYVVVILCFAAAYFGVTNFQTVPFLHTHTTPLIWYEAIVLSISSFHGRGLFPTGLALGDPIAIIAAAEAIIGLLIEITFIATFTQRYFAR